jgi:hypothetical protein
MTMKKIIIIITIILFTVNVKCDLHQNLWHKVGYEEIPKKVVTSKDEQLIAIVDQGSQSIKIYETESWKLTTIICNNDWNDIQNIIFSNDNQSIYMLIKENSELKLISVNISSQEIKKLFQLEKAYYNYTYSDFTPNGKYFTAMIEESSTDVIIEVWEMDKGEKLYEYSYDRMWNFINYVISPDSKYLVCSDWDGVYFLDIQDGSIDYNFEVNKYMGYAINTSNFTNHYFFRGNDSLFLYEFNFDDSKLKRLWSQYIIKPDIYKLVLLPDIDKIFIPSNDSLQILSYTDGSILHSTRKDRYYSSYISVNKSKQIVCAGYHPCVKETNNFSTIHNLSTHFGQPTVQITSDNQYGLTYTELDGTYLWDLKTGGIIKHYGQQINLLKNRNQYYEIKDSIHLIIHDLLTDEIINEHSLPIKTKEVIFDKTLTRCQLLPYVYENIIMIYDLVSKAEVTTYTNYWSPLSFSENNKYFAGIEFEFGRASVRDFDSNELIFETSSDRVTYISFSYDENYFFVKYMNGKIDMFDLNSKSLKLSLQNDDYFNSGRPIIPIPNNQYLFDNGQTELLLWDLGKGEIIKQWGDWIGKSFSASISNNYKYILAGYSDGSVVCYETNFDFGTSVDNTESDNYNTLHPNPATSQITLSLGEEFISAPEIDIIDYLGNAIIPDYEINGLEMIINTSSLSPGVYFLRVRSGEKLEVRKFVVGH